MILSVEELRARVDCGTETDEQLTVKLKAIEAIIRKYTNNNFQNRGIRFAGDSDESGVYVYGQVDGFRVGDTVQISASDRNNGLFVIVAIDDGYIQLDAEILPCSYNLVTKIEYPDDVVQCAVDLFTWKKNRGDKVGVKSETISRHSVTYEDSGTLFMGYPTGIINGLALHKKARC